MQSIELTKSNDRTDDVHVLSHRFTKELELPERITLKNIILYHNWKNISSKLGDFSFLIIKFTESPSEPNLASDRTTLPDGSYSVNDINNFIHLTMNAFEGEDDLFRDFGINLHVNATYNRITVEIKRGYGLRLSNDLAELLGSESTNLDGKLTKNLENAPKIENVEKINVKCDLVRNDIQKQSSLRYSFTPSSGIARIESPKIYFPIWKPTRATKVDSVSVWLTNQDGKPIEFEDNWSVTILLSESEQ